MNIELNQEQIKYLCENLEHCLDFIKEAWEDNTIFYEDDQIMADEEERLIKGILEKLNNKECSHDYEPVAFNDDFEGGKIELWDCICKKCGKHSILNIKGEK